MNMENCMIVTFYPADHFPQVCGLEREGDRVPQHTSAHHCQAGGVPAEPEREKLHFQEVQIPEARFRMGSGGRRMSA